MKRLGFLLVTVALIAGACGGDPAAESTTTTTSTTLPVTATTGGATGDLLPVGGVATYHWRLQQGSVNPYLGGPRNDLVNLNVLMIPWLSVGGVWQWNGLTNELEPNLIVEFPTLDNGGFVLNDDGSLTVRYEIDPDAVWSDGVPISGEDFAFTARTVVESTARLASADDAGTPFMFSFCGFEDEMGMDWAIGAPYLAIDLESMVAGPKSFEYRLADSGLYDRNLFRWLIPRHAVEGTDFLTDWNDRLWPSSGPFVLEEADLDAGRAVFARNERYWKTHPDTGQQLPLLDGFVLDGLTEEGLSRVPDPYPYDHDSDPATPPIAVEGLHEWWEADAGCPGHAPEVVGLDPDSEEVAILRAAAGGAFDRAVLSMLRDGLHVDYNAFIPAALALATESGFDVTRVVTSTWEHIAFHYGDARLRANEDSLVEHLQFRQAVAHAIDKDRIAAEAVGSAGLRIDSILATYSGLDIDGWEQYDYDVDRARELLADLCNSLGRDCEVDPPRLVLDHSPFPYRFVVADLLTEMLGDVGIAVETRTTDLLDMVYLADCSGWEMSTWAWTTDVGFAPFAQIFEIIDPASDGGNVYAWGTGPGDDDLDTADCDESQGVSSVRNEFTERYAELYSEVRALNSVVQRDSYLPRLLELEALLAQEVAFIPLFVRSVGYAVRDDLIGGYGFTYDPGPKFGPWLWNVDRWYRKDLG